MSKKDVSSRSHSRSAAKGDHPPGKKSKQSVDSVYSQSYKYNQIGNKTTNRQIGKKQNKKGSNSTLRKSVKDPHKKATPSNSGTSLSEEFTMEIDESISKDWGIDEKSIRKMVGMYFEYIICEKSTKSKITKITIGNFNEKKTYKKDKLIEVYLSDICL